MVDDWKRSEHDCTDQIRAMVELAFSVWEKRNFSEPSPGVDPELFGELEAILESQSTHSSSYLIEKLLMRFKPHIAQP